MRFSAFFRRRRKAVAGYLFISPWLIGFLAFTAYPMFDSLYMSFNKVYVSTTGIAAQWIGWGNYAYAFFTDPQFLVTLVTFLESAVLEVPVIIVFSLFVALLINQPIRLKGAFRAVFFLPVVITSGQVVNQLFSQGAGTVPLVQKYGIITLLQTDLGPALSAPIISVIQQLIMVLWFSGVQILIFLAGLQKVNSQTYEAAAIDGASPWQSFWKITLPEVKPFIIVNVVYTIVNLFTDSLNTVVTLIKTDMFDLTLGYGYANALAWIYFIVTFVIMALVILVFGRNEQYGLRRSS